MHFRANVVGIVGALATALALGSCANVDMENKDAWFSKPFQFASSKGGFTFSELQESKVRSRPVIANDLIEANGSCPPAAQQAAASAPVDPSGGAPPATDTGALLSGGIALGMSECDVVFRAGAPSDIQIDQNPNHARTTVLTFNSGPHPGIYHFRGGALMEIERGQITPQTQTAKKKPVTSPKPNKQAAKE